MSRTEPSTARSAWRRLPVAAVAFALLLAACGSSDELGGKVVEDGQGCTITSVDRDTSDVPTIEKGATVGETSEASDIEKADEDACKADAKGYLTVDLIGATTKDGKVFTNTFDDDQPYTVLPGQTPPQLIAGLESSLVGMGVGGRRQIIIPAAEAYGADGDESLGIGKDADLEFIVDLISISDTPLYCNPAQPIAPPPEGMGKGKPTEVDLPSEPPTDKVVTTVLKEGDGPEVTDKSYVTTNYLGVSCATGVAFDNSWDRDEPLVVALGTAEPTQEAIPVIPGWTEGLVGQKQGSIVQLDIPWEQAYGAAGNPPSIMPKDPLTFIIEIIEVSDEPPPAATTTTVAEGATTTVPPA